MNSVFSNAYQYFLAVARTGSFHKASLELYVSQSAISKSIKLLEEKLGYPLFRRTTRTVSLTPEGKILYSALLECIRIMDLATEKIADEAAGYALSGMLRIGILSNWGIDQFRMPYLTGFFQEHPKVEMLLARLDQRELVERLKQNELDVIVSPLREIRAEPGISYISLGMYPFMLIISRNHPLAQYHDIMDKLDGVNLYTHHQERASVTARLEKMGLNPNIVLVPNVDSKIAAAENGQGCTVVLSCSKAVRSPGIRAYPLRDYQMEVVVAYKNREDALVDTFLNYVSALAEQGGEM